MIKRQLNLQFKSSAFKQMLKNYKVKRIAIFGSYANGTNTKDSDVDFLVEFYPQADLLDQVGLKQDLEELLKKDVDVVTPKALSRYIREKVLHEAVYL